MLETIVRNHDIATGIKQQLRGNGTILTNRNGNTAGAYHAGLITHFNRVWRITKQHRFLVATAIAATYDAGTVATRT
ncbi:hypothetical protein GCM10010981_02670 [Dyella nitratireducens]|uniref:Uncharacterized protein n=1 Tax=Dyella nitratireducens TaxID=1849580 RepID=A0ABQ1FLH1_9GAMM|nr:hypothetical protein GCM10010981_02670 [Dyella nitratireducens]GLQ44671.1 hypothetical protein GCM10007902_45210 [Dyella nitratireducens]